MTQRTQRHDWLGGIALAAALLGLGALASNGPDDTATNAAMQAWSRELVDAARTDHQSLKNAQTACSRLHGQHALVLMTTDGDLVCRHALLHPAGKQV